MVSSRVDSVLKMNTKQHILPFLLLKSRVLDLAQPLGSVWCSPLAKL